MYAKEAGQSHQQEGMPKYGEWKPKQLTECENQMGSQPGWT